MTVSPEYDTLCQGFSTNLTASGAITYSWTPTGGLSTTLGNSVTATPSTSTNYKVVGTSGNGCKDSALAHILVNAKPVVSVTPDSIDICHRQHHFLRLPILLFWQTQ